MKTVKHIRIVQIPVYIKLCWCTEEFLNTIYSDRIEAATVCWNNTLTVAHSSVNTWLFNLGRL